MKRLACAGLLASAALIAQPVDAQNLKRIRSEDQFRSIVVGRDLVSGDSSIRVETDGTVSGKVPRGRVKGKWVWGNGMFCRNVVIGNTALGQDCQVVRSNGKQVVFLPDQGRGEANTTFTIR